MVDTRHWVSITISHPKCILLISGANVPALNELLEHFGIEFGDFVGEGEFRKCY